MKKIKIKAKIKPKCDCENHYLELCTSFDGETYQYQRYCYKCHKTWNYTKSLVEKRSNASRSYITDGGASHSYIYDTYGGNIAVPRMEVMDGVVFCLNIILLHSGDIDNHLIDFYPLLRAFHFFVLSHL